LTAPISERIPAVLRLRDFRALLVTRFTYWFVMSALTVVVGYQVYLLTGDPLTLGLLGLVEAFPALSLSLFGGHLADRRDRRTIYVISQVGMIGSILGLAALSLDPGRFGIGGIYAVIFLTGVSGGFQRPAYTAFEAQVIPLEHMTRGSSLSSGTGQLGGISGPAVGGFLYALIGVTGTYVALAAILAVSVVSILLIAPRPMPVIGKTESLRASLATGIRFVRRSRILLGAMSLDLFAVLFGGTVAMLPIYASDILHVGPVGLGLMRTAPSVGAVLAMSLAAWRPPKAHAGLTLLTCVAGFGIAIIVFALSRDFGLSLLALFMTGATDGVSVVIRSVITRVASPEHLRARIASVEYLFIGASNEVGAFESGVAAKILGVVPSVAIGGTVTLVVVGLVTALVPELRRLDLGQPLLPPDEYAEARAEALAAPSAAVPFQ
jgi:MFS family permease